MLLRRLPWILLFAGIVLGGLFWRPAVPLQSAPFQQTIPLPPRLECSQHTIFAVRSGSWDAPSTWQVMRTPTLTDVVAISSTFVVSLTNEVPRTVALNELCNTGTVDITAPELHFEVNRVLVNGVRGVIETRTISSPIGFSPSNLWLNVADGGHLINDGQITASEEQENEQGTASTGGSITANADWAFLGGAIIAGSGGVGGARGGDGGSVTIAARYGIYHAGAIIAGNGGACNVNPIVAAPDMGGRGGSVTINVSPPTGVIEFAGSSIFAGQDGTCPGSNSSPPLSVVRSDPIRISLSGAGNRIRGGNIVLFTDDGGSIDLSDMDTIAISATGSITLAVGVGGVITMTGGTEPILRAGENITLYADDVVTDSGVTPEELADAKTFQSETSRLLRFVDLWPGADVFPAIFNRTQASSFFLNNISAITDTFQIEATTQSPHWSVSPVQTTVEMSPLELRAFAISVTPQMGAAVQATVVVTVTSQSDPSIKASTTQKLFTIYRSYAPLVWLAQYYRTYAPFIRVLRAASILLRN